MNTPSDSSRLMPPVSAEDHAAGPASAPVTLVEFGDYQCPHCGRAHAIIKEVQRAMGDRLRFVFRNFPITQSHEYAEHAAEAAEAAGAQGKFWAMHDALYEHQHALDDAHLVQYARQLGLDAKRVAQEIEDEAHLDRVRADFMSGVRSGVNGTPTFFIDGVRYDGSWEPDALLAALAAAAKAHPAHSRG